MYLLDTNVISELRKKSPNQNVARWAKKRSTSSLFISAVSILEIEMGILLLHRKDAKQANVYRSWLEKQVLKSFSDRILSFDTHAALEYAALHIPNPKSERDAMIAATAIVHGLSLVTRNEKDFRHIKMDVVNPWSEIDE